MQLQFFLFTKIPVHTHVGFVLWHGGHGVFVRSELYVGFARDSPVGSDLHVHTHRVQRREKLHVE